MKGKNDKLNTKVIYLKFICFFIFVHKDVLKFTSAELKYPVYLNGRNSFYLFKLKFFFNFYSADIAMHLDAVSMWPY